MSLAKDMNELARASADRIEKELKEAAKPLLLSVLAEIRRAASLGKTHCTVGSRSSGNRKGLVMLLQEEGFRVRIFDEMTIDIFW